MRRARIFLAGVMLAAIGLVAAPSDAGTPYCYNIRVYNGNTRVIDQWVGVCSASAQAVSVTTQRIGDTVVQTTRYA